MKFFNQLQTKAHRRSLRKNQTDAERSLWRKLRGKQMYGYKFYRQYGIGNYIVDFYCPKAKLVIEVDGGGHFDEKQKAHDNNREEFMSEHKIRTIRLTNLDVKQNMEGILKAIEGELPLPPL